MTVADVLQIAVSILAGIGGAHLGIYLIKELKP